MEMAVCKRLGAFFFKPVEMSPLNLPAMENQLRSAVLDTVISSSNCQHSHIPGNLEKVEEVQNHVTGKQTKHCKGHDCVCFFFLSAVENV